VQRVRLRQMAEALLRQQMQNQSSDIG